MISAGVITANIIWKPTNAMPGIVPSRLVTFDSQANSKSPMIGPVPPNASVKPTIAHSTEISPIAK